MTVLIKLLIGLNSETFNLFSNIDGYTLAFETAIPKTSLTSGYSSSLVPDGTTTIRIMEEGSSTSYVDIPVNSITGFNFTSKIPSPRITPS